MRVTEQLELRLYQDGTSDIIFWDNKNGNDITATVDKNGVMTIDSKQVSIKDLLEKVKEAACAENTNPHF